MATKTITLKEFIDQLPEDRKGPVKKLREEIVTNLPAGFKETVTPGFINYVVPHALYPDGYHCDPAQPLPFMCVASQKNFIAVYHMGIYADRKLLDWFTAEYPKHSKTKLDMGKSCIRFKKPDEMPLRLIGTLAKKMSPQQWIKIYESQKP